MPKREPFTAPCAPRLLRPQAADAYLSASLSKLAELPITPRKSGSRMVRYDWLDLDAFADELSSKDAANPWDEA
jgi:hypothetical protein